MLHMLRDSHWSDLILPFLHQDIDIKKVNGVPQYAFVQYSDIASVCKAIKKMDGEYLGSNRLKVVNKNNNNISDLYRLSV